MTTPKMILATSEVHGERGYAQHIKTAAHEIQSDEPERRGGTNTGPSPFELLLSSLGACTAITLRMYADRKQWDLGAIDVKLRLVKEGEAQTVERSIAISAALSDEQKAKILEIADKTPVTKALAAGILIKTTLQA